MAVNIETIPVPVGRCGKKLRWPSEEVAHKALEHAKRRRLKESRNKRTEKRAYKCHRCDGWHLTSQERATA